MTRLRLPPERIGRPLIVAFCLAFLAGALGGCDTPASEMLACREMCAPAPVQQFTPSYQYGPQVGCVCGPLCADGGRP